GAGRSTGPDPSARWGRCCRGPRRAPAKPRGPPRSIGGSWVVLCLRVPWDRGALPGVPGDEIRSGVARFPADASRAFPALDGSAHPHGIDPFLLAEQFERLEVEGLSPFESAPNDG